MDIHINKMLAGLILVSLLIGGAIGGAVGFIAGNEEGHGGHDKYEMNGKDVNEQVDNQADGETNDDNNGSQNQDIKIVQPQNSTTSVQVTATTSPINQ